MARKKVLLSVLAAATIAVGGISYAGYRVYSVFFSGIFGVVMAEANRFDAMSKPIILDLADQGWRPEAVKRYATADYAATLDKSSALFEKLRGLGKVTDVSTSLVAQEQDTKARARIGSVETRTAAVARNVTFEEGERRVELDFLWQDKQWRLTGVQAVL